MSGSSGTKKSSLRGIDMVEQNGLRGILSVWIVCFHCLMFDHTPIDIQGSSLMPFFFMLSGFALTVGYYRKIVTDEAVVTLELNPNTKTVTWGSFMYNRLVRVLPVYYICFLMCLPAFFSGFGAYAPYDKDLFYSSLVINIIPTFSWFGSLAGYMFDGPGWTISTLIGFWIFFPMLLRHYARLTDEQLLRDIRFYFIVQLVLAFVIFGVGTAFLGVWPGFVFATFNPLSRWPVFSMGMCAGILCVRHPSAPANSFTDPTAPPQTLPWFRDAGWYLPLWVCCGCCCAKQAPSSATSQDHDMEERLVPAADHAHLLRDPSSPAPTSTYSWSTTLRSQDFSAVLYHQTRNLLTITFLVFLLDTADRYVLKGQGLFGALWLQALNPFAQLNFIVATTRHNLQGQSYISKILRHPITQWLGDLSMSVYLLHWVLQYYIIWANYGKRSISWPDTLDCSEEYDKHTSYYSDCEDTLDDFYHKITWPDWSVLVLPFLSIAVAHVFYHVIEKPVNATFR